MKNYIVTSHIRLEIEASNEVEAKRKAMEDLSDFLRHHSFTDLMNAREKKLNSKERK